MREIKFRAWDKISETMIMPENWLAVQLSGKIIITDFSWNYTIANNDNFELLQFTGLKDKNGVEIYEGDIVKIPDYWNEYGFNAGENYEVYFAFGGFRLKPKYQKNAKGFYLEDDKIEIIGNIYENPELLKS